MSRGIRPALILVVLLVAAVYASVAFSSYPHRVARESPERASLFRPPWFNYFSTYQDGDVLGFKVGASRDELVRTIVSQYGASGLVQAGCGREKGAPPLTVRESDVVASDAEQIRLLAQRQVVCLWLPARRVMLTIGIADDRIHEIELSFVRNELTT